MQTIFQINKNQTISHRISNVKGLFNLFTLDDIKEHGVKFCEIICLMEIRLIKMLHKLPQRLVIGVDKMGINQPTKLLACTY